jgi:hypothetical protein
MARVQNLFRSPKKHFPMEELQEARVLADFGFAMCAHAQPGGSRASVACGPGNGGSAGAAARRFV